MLLRFLFDKVRQRVQGQIDKSRREDADENHKWETPSHPGITNPEIQLEDIKDVEIIKNEGDDGANKRPHHHGGTIRREGQANAQQDYKAQKREAEYRHRNRELIDFLGIREIGEPRGFQNHDEERDEGAYGFRDARRDASEHDVAQKTPFQAVFTWLQSEEEGGETDREAFPNEEILRDKGIAIIVPEHRLED